MILEAVDALFDNPVFNPLAVALVRIFVHVDPLVSNNFHMTVLASKGILQLFGDWRNANRHFH